MGKKNGIYLTRTEKKLWQLDEEWMKKPQTEMTQVVEFEVEVLHIEKPGKTVRQAIVSIELV